MAYTVCKERVGSPHEPRCEPQISHSRDFQGKRESSASPDSLLDSVWCRRGDSNPHGFPHHPLKMACLPGSTTSAREEIHLIHGAAERQAESKSAEIKSAVQGGVFFRDWWQIATNCREIPPSHILSAWMERTVHQRNRASFRSIVPGQRSGPDPLLAVFLPDPVHRLVKLRGPCRVPRRALPGG